MTRTQVKICCITSIAEARLAMSYGADAIGLVGQMPSGPGIIDDELARQIAQIVPPAMESFFLTSAHLGSEIVDQLNFCRATAVQIVRPIEPSEYEVIIERLPETRRIQVIHVEDYSAVALIKQYEPYVDAYLLDSGRPKAKVSELGGTGRVHNWEISKEIVQNTDTPVYLAGGLNAQNIEAAIKTVAPYGVDLCSGVRSNDQLDEVKLAEFVSICRNLG